MNNPTAYHQLGVFIVQFQKADEAVDEIVALLMDDDWALNDVVIEQNFTKRLTKTRTAFDAFVDASVERSQAQKETFRGLMIELGEIAKRRNELVHSMYWPWRDVHGNWGLLRRNAKRLKGSDGHRIREEEEEELQPAAFEKDFERLAQVLVRLEVFRLQIIDWIYPESAGVQ